MIKLRRLRWTDHVARMEDEEWFQNFKRVLGRPRRRWEDNIRIDPKEIGINSWNWVDSA